MYIHLSGKFSVCGGGRGVDSVQFSVYLKKWIGNPKAIETVAYIEDFRPEWCISSMIFSRDTPFWLETLDIIVDVHSTCGE